MTDRQIVEAMLAHDQQVTRHFLLVRCRPMFQGLHTRCFTDCGTWQELANEVYLLMLAPASSGVPCPLASFDGRATLLQWVRTVAVNHCRRLYARQQARQQIILALGDSFQPLRDSVSLAMLTQKLQRHDLDKLLQLMPNPRYRALLRLRYLDGRTNAETAALLHMTLPNYYNKHRLALAQLRATHARESRPCHK